MTTPQPQPMLDREPLLMLMDGHALIHRAWHAIREPLTTRDSGEDTRAIFGFMNIFLKTLDTHKPTHIAAAFDMPTPTFRREMYPQYKEHRPATPEELKSQFQHVEELMNAFGVAGVQSSPIRGGRHSRLAVPASGRATNRNHRPHRRHRHASVGLPTRAR